MTRTRTPPSHRYMSRRTREYAPALTHLATVKSSTKRNRLLSVCCEDPEFVKCVCECVWNVIHGRVPVSSAQKKGLARHRATLRRLADSTVPLTTKKSVLAQKGGFLPLLLPLLAPLLAPVLGSILGGGG